jgi:hypothetical protein
MARKRPTKKQLEMARKYESAWHYLFHQLSDHRQRAVIDEPLGKISTEFAREVAKFAETKDCPNIPPTPSLPTGYIK